MRHTLYAYRKNATWKLQLLKITHTESKYTLTFRIFLSVIPQNISPTLQCRWFLNLDKLPNKFNPEQCVVQENSTPYYPYTQRRIKLSPSHNNTLSPLHFACSEYNHLSPRTHHYIIHPDLMNICHDNRFPSHKLY